MPEGMAQLVTPPHAVLGLDSEMPLEVQIDSDV
jgi:hypothetical protein